MHPTCFVYTDGPFHCQNFNLSSRESHSHHFFQISFSLHLFISLYFSDLLLPFLFLTLHIVYTDRSIKGPQVGLITAKEMSSSLNSERPSWEKSICDSSAHINCSSGSERNQPKHRGAANTKESQGKVNVAGTPVSLPSANSWVGKTNVSQTSPHAGSTGPPLLCCFLSRVNVDVHEHDGTASSQKSFLRGWRSSVQKGELARKLRANNQRCE